MLNVCMIGHGMMGIWHSEALSRTPDAALHTVVGRPRPPRPAGDSEAGPAVPWRLARPATSRSRSSRSRR